jgi:pimeloyl-ACP methyl ester carboxylesterase
MMKVCLPLLLTMFLGSCSTVQGDVSRDTSPKFARIVSETLNVGADFKRFSEPGPYMYSSVLDLDLRVTNQITITGDLFLSQHEGSSPLLIFQHGNLSSKESHRKQGQLAASWGFHSLVLSQPNEGQWVTNGRNLGTLVKMIYEWPLIISPQFDRNKIIIIGHSFGGSAIAIAAGMDSPVKGLIFLDPALYSNRVLKYIPKIKAPGVVLGADRRVFLSRHRAEFFKRYPREIIEVSFDGATHNDAQYPNDFVWAEFFGFLPGTSEERQEQIAGAIVGSAFGLAYERFDVLKTALSGGPQKAIKFARYKESSNFSRKTALSFTRD